MKIIKDEKEEITLAMLKRELRAEEGELEEILNEPTETIRLEFSRFGHKYVLTDLS